MPVPYADLGNPQTLNLYAYVTNNPLNLTDPTGHSITTTPGANCSCAGAHEMLAALHVDSAGGDFGPGEDHVFEAALEAMAVNNAIAIAEYLAQGTAQQQQNALQGQMLDQQRQFNEAYGKPPDTSLVAFTNLRIDVTTQASTATALIGPTATVTMTIVDARSLKPVNGAFTITLVEKHVAGKEVSAQTSQAKGQNFIRDEIRAGPRGGSTSAQIVLVNGWRVNIAYADKLGSLHMSSVNILRSTRAAVYWNGEALIEQNR